MTGQLSFAARDLALMQVENNHQVFVETMRSVAMRLLREKKVISADDLHEWADANNVKAPCAAAWGPIFKSKAFICVGYTMSRRETRHAGLIRQWKLREAL